MTLNLLAWQYGALALALALCTAWSAGVVLKLPVATGRNTAIDGLRGYLAFGVVLFHATNWHAYLRGAPWQPPAPSVYRALGVYCVSVFFMITAFLFVGKLLDAKTRPIDWLALYVSRVLRLTPLFLAATLAIFVVVGALTDWTLRVSPGALIRDGLRWFTFALVDGRDLNGLVDTGLINAGVNWSLKYEWLFYFALPTLALLLRVPTPKFLAFAGVSLIVLVAMTSVGTFFPIAFGQGAVAAVVARQARISAVLRHPVAGVYVLGAAWVLLFASPGSLVVKVLLTSAFAIVACGNVVFGLLSNRAAILLGDFSYGVYLLHGLMLTTVFTFVVGRPQAAALSVAGHWTVVSITGVVVVGVSAVSYRFLEMPALRRTKPLTARLRGGRATTAPAVSAVV